MRYSKIDKVKLVLIYSLRYEGDDRIQTLKNMLGENGIPSEQIRLIDSLINYAGVRVRSNDLFNNKNLLARAKSSFMTVLQNIPNVFTQHKPYLSFVLDNLIKGKLKETEFPATAPFNPRER